MIRFERAPAIFPAGLVIDVRPQTFEDLEAKKALRLSKVRRDILTPSEDLSVTDAAMRWGFCQLGRFAGDYRKFFGRLPSAERALIGRTVDGASRRR